MKDRGILFSLPMVQAILAGNKTQTRRALKPQPPLAAGHYSHKGASWTGEEPVLVPTGSILAGRNPYGAPGGRLWVRETFFAWGYWIRRHNKKKQKMEWHFVDQTLTAGKSYHFADKPPEGYRTQRRQESNEPDWWKRPSIFMPRVASRISLEIEEIRVERLQGISEQDAGAEGPDWDTGRGRFFANARMAFHSLWCSINGTASWDANPWCWVLQFRVLP